MAIESEQKLAQLLANAPSLTNRERIEIMQSAYFVGGRLRGLYIAPMMKSCPVSEIKAFFVGAEAFLVGTGDCNLEAECTQTIIPQVMMTHRACHETVSHAGYPIPAIGNLAKKRRAEANKNKKELR